MHPLLSPDTGLNAVLACAGYELTRLPRAAFDDSEGTILLEQMMEKQTQTTSISGDGMHDVHVVHDSELVSSKNNYLAVGAAGAVLKYMHDQQNLVFAPSSLSIARALCPHFMYIDAPTIDALELVSVRSSGLCSGSSSGDGTTLLQFLDGCQTRAGKQLLRANILQPLTDIPTLNARLDALDELRSKYDLTMTVMDCIGQLPKNMDGVCGSLILRSAKTEAATMRRVATMIQSFIQLRELLTALDPLAEVLQDAECDLLKTVHSLVSNVSFSHLLLRLDGLLDEEVRTSTASFLNRARQCFALRSDSIPMLEIARQAFYAATEAVHQHADEVRGAHGLVGGGLKVKYTARRGFYLSVNMNGHGGGGGYIEPNDNDKENKRVGNKKRKKRKNAGGSSDDDDDGNGNDNGNGGGGRRRQTRNNLPSCFIILNQASSAKTKNGGGGGSVQCTTDQLNALNIRLRDASNDCLAITEEALESTAADIISEYLPSLHRLIDGLAVLDMLCGFVRKLNVFLQDEHAEEENEEDGRIDRKQKKKNASYVRPVFTDGIQRVGPLALVKSRHPIIEATDGSIYPFQSNDTWLSLDSSLHIITGPNMAGKSTYLKQVGLCVVMAQLGCLVPASFASITPVDCIMTRIGACDSLETNSSSFMVEMKETAHILKTATPRSLVLIDELGRATSTKDGLAVAWAVAEELAVLGAKTLFATHFPELATLAVAYPQIQTFHFQCRPFPQEGERENINSKILRLRYDWKLLPGRPRADGNNAVEHYGIALAECVAFPEEAVKKAKEVVATMEKKKPCDSGQAEAHNDPGCGVLRVSVDEVDSSLEEEQAVWEIVGKLACLVEAYEKSNIDEEKIEMVTAVRRGALETMRRLE